MFNLIGEMQELAGEPYAVRRHMAWGLCRLLDARYAYYVSFNGFTPTGAMSVRAVAVGGRPEQQLLRDMEVWGRRMLRDDPLTHRCTFLPGSCYTFLRRQLTSVRDWQRSGIYETLPAIPSIGDVILGFYRRREPGVVTGFSIQRERGMKGYTERERRLVALFNTELYRLYRLGQFEGEPPGVHIIQGVAKLPPRQRQVLEWLLGTGSVPTGAAALNMSQHTFNDHVRTIYDKFSVTSRLELMAKFTVR